MLGSKNYGEKITLESDTLIGQKSLWHYNHDALVLLLFFNLVMSFNYKCNSRR